VIIGAMVIAPLMSSILGISLGVVQGDTRLLWDAAGTLLKGTALTIGVGLLLSLAVPDRQLTGEALGRTQPTLLDLGVALAAGAVAAYALCRKRASEAVAGVAIAVALAPPLGTIGIALAMLNGKAATGALLLYLTNLSAILASSSAVFILFGFRPDPGRRFRVFGRSMAGVIVLLVVVSTVLTVLTVGSIRSTQTDRALRDALQAETDAMEGVRLESWQVVDGGSPALQVEVEVQAAEGFSRQEGLALQERLVERLGRPVALTLSVVPTTRLELASKP
jgi:uncharacterized hydrophobic protein (TIGR00271 family)